MQNLNFPKEVCQKLSKSSPRSGGTGSLISPITCGLAVVAVAAPGIEVDLENMIEKKLSKNYYSSRRK